MMRVVKNNTISVTFSQEEVEEILTANLYDRGVFSGMPFETSFDIIDGEIIIEMVLKPQEETE